MEQKQTFELDFTINNAGNLNQVVLFGSSLFLTADNYGSDQQITVSSDWNVSYVQILRDSGLNPFTVQAIRMQCTDNPAQVVRGITLVSRDIYGDVKREPISMISSVSEYQEQLSIANLERPFNITSDAYLTFSVLPRISVLCTLSITRTINNARRLHGLNVLADYPSGFTGVKPLLLK